MVRMNLGFERRDRAHGALVALAVRDGQRGRAGCGLQAGPEAAQVGVDRLAVGADRGLERRGRDRQHVGRRELPVHDGDDHLASAAGERRHVEQHMPPRMGLDRLHEAAGVIAAVGHRHPFRDRIGAMGGGDEGGAIRCHEAVADRARPFHQFARQHDVDVAAARGQRQHGASAGERRRGHRQDLDVIGGGASALRDPGDRGALHWKALCGRRRHDPVGQHAAALAAERGDQHRDRAACRHAAACTGCGSDVRSGVAAIGSSRRRTAWRRRSYQPGFLTISAR